MFEQSILFAVPSILFLLLVPIKLYSLHGATAKTVSNHMCSCKGVSFQFCHLKLRRSFTHVLNASQATAIIFAAIRLAILIIQSTDFVHRTPTSIPSASVLFSAAVAVCFLSYVEHSRSVRPSTPLNLYLFLSLLLDTIQAQTLFLLDDALLLGAVYASGLVVKVYFLLSRRAQKPRP